MQSQSCNQICNENDYAFANDVIKYGIKNDFAITNDLIKYAIKNDYTITNDIIKYAITNDVINKKINNNFVFPNTPAQLTLDDTCLLNCDIKMGKLFGGTVPPNNIQFGKTPD